MTQRELFQNLIKDYKRTRVEALDMGMTATYRAEKKERLAKIERVFVKSFGRPITDVIKTK